jgi:hypothetical protein
MTFFLATTLGTRLVHRTKDVRLTHWSEDDTSSLVHTIKYRVRQIDSTIVMALRMPEVGPTSTALHTCIASITEANKQRDGLRFGIDKVDVGKIIGVLHSIQNDTGTTL